MSDFEFDTLSPSIREILSAPGTDLSTISAKRVRKQLLELQPTLTAEFLKENKESVDAVIASVFEAVSAERGGVAPPPQEDGAEEDVKRKREYDEGGEGEGSASPPPKKVKKAKTKSELSDAELARQLSNQINSRSRRSAATNGASSPKKGGGRKKKSAALVEDSDDEADSADGGVKKSKAKKKSSGGGTAKGGFGKEYILSEPLSAVLNFAKLSRPQVVKRLWEYIKGNELQNPDNKREIMCDGSLRAVFGVDKIDMFKMNKVLGQHLHENEG